MNEGLRHDDALLRDRLLRWGAHDVATLPRPKIGYLRSAGEIKAALERLEMAGVKLVRENGRVWIEGAA